MSSLVSDEGRVGNGGREEGVVNGRRGGVGNGKRRVGNGKRRKCGEWEKRRSGELGKRRGGEWGKRSSVDSQFLSLLLHLEKLLGQFCCKFILIFGRHTKTISTVIQSEAPLLFCLCRKIVSLHFQLP